MIEKQIIKLMIYKFLINKDFYTEYKGRVSRNVFQGSFGSLYDTVQKAHDKYDSDISIDELYSLHTAVFNPALTRAAKEQFSELLEDIKETQEPSKQIADDIIKILIERDVAQKIAIEATEIFNGKPADFNFITNLIEKHKTGLPTQKLDAVTNDITELLEELNVVSKWQFNLTVLKNNIGGIGPGNLMIAFARPETGKTAFWVSLVSAPYGFAEQGAKVHAFINEEPAVRTQMRAISCFTGLNKEQITEDVPKAREEWIKIKDNITMIDTVDWSMDDIDSHCEKHKPDIIVIDQLDKVNISGTFARTDEKLRAIYTSAREIAKRRQCVVIAISQASAEAQNRNTISFDMMENSKTGKAAEADLIIGIGSNTSVDPTSNMRILNVSKNKITGWHGDPSCLLDKYISRFTD
jgi:replicative DNA helicase